MVIRISQLIHGAAGSGARPRHREMGERGRKKARKRKQEKGVWCSTLLIPGTPEAEARLWST